MHVVHRSGLLGEVVAGAQAVALQEGLVTEGGTEPGYRLVTNTGPQAGQSVHHVHFHLLGGRRDGVAPRLSRPRGPRLRGWCG